MVKLLYGSGLRIMEVVRLRVQNLAFDNKQLIVRDGKGNKDRSTLLPDPIHQPLKTHLERVKTLHQEDLQNGHGSVYLPEALARKYTGAPKAWNWHSMCSHQKNSQSTHGVALSDGTTLMNLLFKKL